jgi:hypothetical protein
MRFDVPVQSAFGDLTVSTRFHIFHPFVFGALVLHESQLHADGTCRLEFLLETVDIFECRTIHYQKYVKLVCL